MPLYQARELAKSHGLDLVEVAPVAVPPVCRLLDYGRYKYEQSRKEREARKGQKLSVLRQIRLRPKIGDHDFEAKVRTAKKLLEGGDKVKVEVMFRGREITHPDIGARLLQRVAESLKDVSTLDGRPLMEDRRMNVMLSPVASQKTKVVKTKETNETEGVQLNAEA
jgi:translation initiation factor IF-3